MTRTRILLAFFFILVALGRVPVGHAQEPDFTDLRQVLSVFEDSRKTRDLKEFGSDKAKADFVRTLENEVYGKVDDAVIKHLGADPEFAGKRMMSHDFRTPGVKGVSVNTDRDVRILVEVEPNRWIEVPTDKWQDVYYREFAGRTGYKSDVKTPFDKLKSTARQAEMQEIRSHADKYRQLATDKFHMEASPDYSDQMLAGGRKDSSVRLVRKPAGGLVLESCPNVVRVKAGEGRMASAEGMAQMYFQKSWDQLGKAEDIARRLKAPALPEAERARLEDMRKMYTSEGLVQMKKGVETLEKVRTSYQKQEYRVGELPENVKQAMEIVKAVNGTSRTDVDAVLRNLQEHGFRNPVEMGRTMQGQMESLKLAARQTPPSPPSIRLQAAGKVAGWAGDILSIDQRLKEAGQGRHIIEFLNLKKGDSAAEAFIKKAGIAAVELLPVPVIDAVERGWRVDDKARANIEAAIKRGEADWTTHPAFVMFAVASTVTAETVASMTVDPLMAGGQAVKEGVLMGWDVGNNFLADFSHAEQQRLLREMKHDSHERAMVFDLGMVISHRGGFNGGPLVGDVDVGEIVAFSVRKNDRWTDAYSLRWELDMPNRQKVVMDEGRSAADAEAGKIQFAIAEGFSPGPHTITIRIFERATGLQVDASAATFNVSGKLGIGGITASVGHFLAQGGAPLVPSKSPVKVGEILAFEVPRIGVWSGKHEVQWLVNGEHYKTAPGNDPKAHMLRFDSTGMAPGPCNVAVRLIDTAGKVRKIVAHQGISLRLVKRILTMESFHIRATLNDYSGPPLPATVQNGEILAFQADLKHPEEDPEPAQLFWQVYDRAGNTVPGLGKQEQILEAGVTKNHRFRIQLEDLADGEYTVGLTHLFNTNPDARTQAAVRFRVAQSVRIDRVLVTDNPEDQTHKAVLTPDQAPLLYAHYRLGPGVKKATITLTAKDAGGRVIEAVTVERPRPGETPPYRAGLAVPNAKIPVGAEVTFEARIVADNGKTHTARTSFKKESYRLVLELPNTLRSGENKQFFITVPKNFQGPFAVDVRAAGRGFSVGHTPGALQGTVGGIAAAAPEVGNLTVAVTDTAGKKAAAQARVVIEPREERFFADPEPAPISPVPAYKPPVYTPPVVSSQPRQTFPSHDGIEKGTSARPRRPAQTPASGDTAAGKKKWAQIVDGILSKTIHPCYRGAVPQTVDKLRRQMLDFKSVDFATLAKMDARQLSRFTSQQEKLFAQKAVYETIMRSGLSEDCLGKMIELLAFQGLISSAQAAAYREKRRPKTIYWVVNTSTWSKRGNNSVTTGRAHITTGSRPPTTGFSQPVPGAPGHYYVVVKAYGTLDQHEAQQIANDINQRKYRDVFPRTRYGGSGHIGKGYEGVPLVSYGRGVEALVKR